MQIMQHRVIKILLFGFFLKNVASKDFLVFNQIDIEMGNVGSDDDIRIKICDNSKCCTTKVLHNLLSGEWSPDRNETWNERKLGNCSEILFQSQISKVDVSILKDGFNAGPEIDNMVLTAHLFSNTSVREQFQCGYYKLSEKEMVKTRSCRNSALNMKAKRLPILSVKKIDVQMGSIGSDDDIRIRICDAQKCCTTEILSHFFSGEWVKNKNETWSGDKLNDCSEAIFDVTSSLLNVTLLKDGTRDGPKVNNILLTGQNNGSEEIYFCGSFYMRAKDSELTNVCGDIAALESINTDEEMLLIDKINVKIGSDGTDDDVTIEVPFDTNLIF